MKPEHSILQLISQYASKEWHVTLSTVIDQEPELLINGKPHSTLIKLSEEMSNIHANLKQDFEIDDAARGDIIDQLETIARNAVSSLALQDSASTRGLPIVRAQRNFAAINIDVSGEIDTCLADVNPQQLEPVIEIALSSLKRGDTKVALSALMSLQNQSHSPIQPNPKMLTSAFLNGLIAAQGATTISHSLKMQEELVKILEIADIDAAASVKGVSIEQYCASNEDLAYVNNYVSNARLHKQLETMQSAAPSEDEFTMVRTDRSF